MFLAPSRKKGMPGPRLRPAPRLPAAVPPTPGYWPLSPGLAPLGPPPGRASERSIHIRRWRSRARSARAIRIQLRSPTPEPPGRRAEAAVDFNTYVPFSSGTYNPSGRFTAVDDGQFGNGFEWLSNLPSTQGGGFYNSGLFTLLSWLILDHAQVPLVGGRPRPRATPGRASSIIIEF